MSGSSSAGEREGEEEGEGIEGGPPSHSHTSSAFSHLCLLLWSSEQELGGAQGEGEGKPAFVQHQALELFLGFEVITSKECIKHVYTVL